MATSLKPDIVITPSDLQAQIANVSTTVPYTTITPELGVRAVAGDGREYRYVQAGASALIIGQVQQCPALTTSAAGTMIVAAVGVTSLALTISSSTFTAGALAGGYFQTYGTVANGGGQNLKIATNTAVTAGTAITITLEDPLQVATTASANFTLVPPKYAGVIQMPTTATGSVVGVAVNPLVASYYGWIQIKGIANVLIQGTPAIGTALAAPASTAGAAAVTSGTTAAPNFNVGMNLATGVDGRYGPVDLLIS